MDELIAVDQAIGLVVVGAVPAIQRITGVCVHEFPTIPHAIAIRVGQQRIGAVDVNLIQVSQPIAVKIVGRIICQGNVRPEVMVGEEEHRRHATGLIGARRFPHILGGIAVGVQEGFDHVVRSNGNIGDHVRPSVCDAGTPIDVAGRRRRLRGHRIVHSGLGSAVGKGS